MADKRDQRDQRRNWRVDAAVRKFFAAAIIVLATVALLMLLFGDRVDSPRVVDDNQPVGPPSGEPAPTTPAPPAVPRNQ